MRLRIRRTLAGVLVLLAATVPGIATYASARPIHDHGATETRNPGGEAPSAAGSASATPALYPAEDRAFLHHMMMHHEQALDMAALVEGRATRAEFIRFAGYVAEAQAVEMDIMRSMLEMAEARGLQAPIHRVGGDPPMAGMLSSAEMGALAAARDAEFERRWLEGMIFHHEGGLAMARVQELRQAADGRQPYGLAVLVEDILVGQRAEITQMRWWLDQWNLASGADRRPPAVEVVSPASGATVRKGGAITLYGVAVDDTAIAAARIGIHDLTTDRWLRSDDSWGRRTLLDAERVGSGPASAAWRFTFVPPSRGRYALEAEVEDAAGNRTSTTVAHVLEVN